MKRFKMLILIFTAALAVPLGYFVVQSYQSFEKEEAAQLRYFAETIFDDMEQVMAALVQREERRSVDAYNSSSDPPIDTGQSLPAPLSEPPAENFIVGYFQNNPDGSFQSPLHHPQNPKPATSTETDDRLRRVNRIFNTKLAAGNRLYEPKPAAARPPALSPVDDSFAARYLKRSETGDEKSCLGQQEKQIRELSADQAVTLVQKDRSTAMSAPMAADEAGTGGASTMAEASTTGGHIRKNAAAKTPPVPEAAKKRAPERKKKEGATTLFSHAARIRVEIEPLQSIFIENDLVLIYRRIMMDNRIIRQGFVIETANLLKNLAESRFSSQPMSRFTRLTLQASDGERTISLLGAGVPADAPRFILTRTFPRPFSFLTATLACRHLPRSPGRDTLNIMIGILAAVVAAGLFVIYRSVQALVDLSERRSKFVSSVTHELKTPLTNIRMYVEMLEQGLACTPEREQEYFRILGSESGRLARLINNILEFSKLQKKELRLDLQTGTPDAAIQEACSIMEEALKKEGFIIETRLAAVPEVKFDREMLIQVLTNLLENSVKFGRLQDLKRITVRLYGDGRWVRIDVSDTGPGIPRQDLKRIFDDFYRVENALIRSTPGTGIGLAFVRKVMAAMNGRVSAANNDGPGCTLTLWLPGSHR